LLRSIETIARAAALDLELSAFFLEAWRGLAHGLRSEALEWTLSYRAGECTEVLIVSPRTQERFSRLSELPVKDRGLRRRLERLEEGLSELLGEVSEACDHSEDKAHGTLCTFSGTDGALKEVSLEVFALEHYASETIKLRLEVARARSLRDAVAIPMHFGWRAAVSTLDDKALRAQGWTQQTPEEPWAWLVRHTLVGLQGEAHDCGGADVLKGLVALKSKAMREANDWEPVTERAVDQAIGELALTHDHRSLDIEGEDERRYWEEPPHNLAHALTWRIVAKVVARHIETRTLAVFELHPGGGQGDTLSLHEMDERSPFGVELNDFRAYRRLGRDMPKGQPDPLGNGGFYVRRARFTRDFEGLIDDVCARCGLPAGSPPEDPLSHPQVLTYAVMAQLLDHHSRGPTQLEWRSAVHDSSGYEGTHTRRAFDAEQGGFTTILKALPKATEGTMNPLYGLWMLVHREEWSPPSEDVLLVVRPETGTAWITSKGKHPKALDLTKALKKEGHLDGLAHALWAKRLKRP
jgi:hypothetical protein